MAAKLILCATQADASRPYQFKITGIKVWSVEEAAYHCYHYWKQSLEEFASPPFLQWIRETLGLPFLASKITLLNEIKSVKDKFLAFLSLFDYFDEIQLATLKARLSEWEKRREWEQLKEQGDYLLGKGEAAKAVLYYAKALETQENYKLLNNMGVALMACWEFQEAGAAFERAAELMPRSVRLLLNMAEAAIMGHSFEKALRALGQAEELDALNPDIQYLYGELNFEAGNIRYSIDYFKKAIAIKPEAHYIFRLTDVYIKLRRYDAAEENLNTVSVTDRDYFIKLAELHYAADNLPAAIKALQRALLTNNGDIALWIRLAMYHRLDYDLTRASSAIMKAMSLDRANKTALLEQARIKKAMGKTKEYQALLRDILTGFKREYRESAALGRTNG